ncbi:MAG: tetrathionate reductase family octaheme c-type cytochrome, partial [Gammaproteobacteria bacterium]
MKGDFVWGENLAPEYYWFDGQVRYTLLGDKIDDSQPVAEINSTLPGYGTFPNRQWELLRAGQQMAQDANVPLLMVNEP